jgi:hypothetical protein
LLGKTISIRRKQKHSSKLLKTPGRSPVAQMASAQQDNSKAPADAAPVENGQDPASNPGEDEWDEERLEKAMNTLKEMHIQVGTQGPFRWTNC